MTKLLYGFDLNGDLIGATADLATDDIQFFVSGPGQFLKAFDTVMFENYPEKFVWEAGCLLRCELTVKLPIYTPINRSSEAEKIFSSVIDDAAAKLKDPRAAYIVEMRLKRYFLLALKPSVPIVEYFPATEPARLVLVSLKLDVLCYASKDLPVASAVSKLIIPGLVDQFATLKKAFLPCLLSEHPQVSCKIINVRSGVELPEKCRELALHFQTQGTPVMIGGGVVAYTLLGKAVDSEGRSFFLHDKCYNLLLPERPNMV
ncbi:hypothetical protein AAC387_Pa02g0349 [Persea americana]